MSCKKVASPNRATGSTHNRGSGTLPNPNYCEEPELKAHDSAPAAFPNLLTLDKKTQHRWPVPSGDLA